MHMDSYVYVYSEISSGSAPEAEATAAGIATSISTSESLRFTDLLAFLILEEGIMAALVH